MEHHSHPFILSLQHLHDCQGFSNAQGCPFAPDNAAKDGVHHTILFDHEVFHHLKEQCPAFEEGCAFSGASQMHPKVTSLHDAHKCPAFKDGACPFGGPTETHPDISQYFAAAFDKCEAFQNGCPFDTNKHILSHFTESGSLEDSLKKCQAFEHGCPFGKDGAKDNVHALPLLHVQELIEKCPAFEQNCPFTSEDNDAHPVVTSLRNIHKCPAFRDNCFFAAATDIHPDISANFEIDFKSCPAFESGCPFDESRAQAAANSCPYMQQVGKSLDVNAMRRKLSGDDEGVFWQGVLGDEGCPFKNAEGMDQFESILDSIPKEHFGKNSGEVEYIMKTIRSHLQKANLNDDVNVIDALKEQCPAFSQGCPFSQ